MKSIILTLISIFTSLSICFAQDTITVMQYNLLYYGSNTNWCNSNNNNIHDKDTYIKTILKEIKPDIITVCEFANNQELIYLFLKNNLNINGESSWKASSVINIANSNIINCIFYKSDKLKLKHHSVAQSHLRDIDVFELFFKTKDLIYGDTIDLICVVAHLKSSSGTQNQNTRKIMMENTLNYLDDYHPNENILMMGDFNFYSSDEPAYQLMTNKTLYPNSYFIDPLGKEANGKWHNNISFSKIHTQSTKIDGNNCHSGGGLDDRFDFIMMSENISTGRDDILYIKNSYQAFGQDGKHFNANINDNPQNTSLPEDVIEALYQNSDHLPVIAKLSINSKIGIDELQSNNFNVDIYPNPSDDIINIDFFQDENTTLYIELINHYGQLVLHKKEKYAIGQHKITLHANKFQKGLYLFKISNESGDSYTSKIIIN